MEITLVLNKYKYARYAFFKWRFNLELYSKIILAVGFACFTALLAQARFYLPGSPVPLTGQTFAVVLSAVILGKWWGGISQSIYLGVGIAGVPWFAGMNGGVAYLAGPTGGYLIGFVLASFFLGYCVDSFVRSRKYWTLFALMFCANFGIVFGFGLLQLYGWLSLTGVQVDLWGLLLMGLIPFIIGDIIKIAIAAGIASSILPKQAYGHERDTV
jgi:biotin transport system substrate-specific component